MGGRVFIETTKINKEHIESTVGAFKKELLSAYPNASTFLSSSRYLGSVGKKPQSGDIDLSIQLNVEMLINAFNLSSDALKEQANKFFKRARKASYQKCYERAVIDGVGKALQDLGMDVSLKGTGSRILFLRYPQYDADGILDKNVQLDLMFGDQDWLDFAYYSEVYSGNVKGLHRTQLLLSMFVDRGLSFSHVEGVKKDGVLIATTTNQAIDLLAKEYGIEVTRASLMSYFSLFDIITDLEDSVQQSILDRFLRILDYTRCDIPDNLQEYWIESKERLSLTGKFLPQESRLCQE